MIAAIVVAIVFRKTPRVEMCQRAAGGALRTASGECLVGLLGRDNGIPQSGFALDRKPLNAPQHACKHGAGPATWHGLYRRFCGVTPLLLFFACFCRSHFSGEVSLRAAQEIVRRLCACWDSDMATCAEPG